MLMKWALSEGYWELLHLYKTKIIVLLSLWSCTWFYFIWHRAKISIICSFFIQYINCPFSPVSTIAVNCWLCLSSFFFFFFLFFRSLLEAGGVERLMNITRQRQKYTPRVLKFAGQVLFTMWQHQELREVYKKHGWKEQDFVTKTVAARNAGPNSPNNANSTLNRPMASQGGTRYEDRTMQRSANMNSASRSPGPSIYQRVSLIFVCVHMRTCLHDTNFLQNVWNSV